MNPAPARSPSARRLGWLPAAALLILAPAALAATGPTPAPSAASATPSATGAQPAGGAQGTVAQAAPAALRQRAEVEALIRRAEGGDAAAAEAIAGHYRRGAVLLWDPPSALRWYVAAALGGSETAAADAVATWKGLKPLHRLRARALLAQGFTDEQLARAGIGPIDRDQLRKLAWTAQVRTAGFADAPPPPAAAPTPASTAGAPAAASVQAAHLPTAPTAATPAKSGAVAATAQAASQPASQPAAASAPATAEAAPPVPRAKPRQGGKPPPPQLARAPSGQAARGAEEAPAPAPAPGRPSLASASPS